jgi:hypothetical protein
MPAAWPVLAAACQRALDTRLRRDCAGRRHQDVRSLAPASGAQQVRNGNPELAGSAQAATGRSHHQREDHSDTAAIARQAQRCDSEAFSLTETLARLISGRAQPAVTAADQQLAPRTRRDVPRDHLRIPRYRPPADVGSAGQLGRGPHRATGAQADVAARRQAPLTPGQDENPELTPQFARRGVALRSSPVLCHCWSRAPRTRRRPGRHAPGSRRWGPITLRKAGTPTLQIPIADSGRKPRSDM